MFAANACGRGATIKSRMGSNDNNEITRPEPRSLAQGPSLGVIMPRASLLISPVISLILLVSFVLHISFNSLASGPTSLFHLVESAVCGPCSSLISGRIVLIYLYSPCSFLEIVCLPIVLV